MPGGTTPYTPTHGKTLVVPNMTRSVIDAAVAALPAAIAAAVRSSVKSANGKDQVAALSLVIQYRFGKASPNDPATIFVSLENSQINPGGMMVDQNDRRGFFQDRIDVLLWIEDPTMVSATSTPRFFRISDGPQTGNGSSSTSSSVSFGFSSSGNVGFFGPTPTGGASIGTNLSETHGFSKSLSDFRVENISDAMRAQHTYFMSATESGSAYSKPVDLVPKPGDIGFLQSFSGIVLHRPPPMATANLELISQCVWQAATNDEVTDTLRLGVRITQRVVMVGGTNNFVSVATDAPTVVEFNYEQMVDLPFGDINDKQDDDEDDDDTLVGRI